MSSEMKRVITLTYWDGTPLEVIVDNINAIGHDTGSDGTKTFSFVHVKGNRLNCLESPAAILALINGAASDPYCDCGGLIAVDAKRYCPGCEEAIEKNGHAVKQAVPDVAVDTALLEAAEWVAKKVNTNQFMYQSEADKFLVHLATIQAARAAKDKPAASDGLLKAAEYMKDRVKLSETDEIREYDVHSLIISRARAAVEGKSC